MNEEELECLKKPDTLELPKNINLPFLTYGFFKPGQVAFSQIENYTSKRNITPVYIEATLKDINGMPVLIDEYDEGNKPVKGYIIEFLNNKKTPYNKICNSKDSHLYSWKTTEYNGKQINVLVSADTEKMRELFNNPDISNSIENRYDYDWRNDPVFNYTPKFIESRLDDLAEKIYSAGNDTYKQSLLFVEVQSLYMVLWSALDRFLTFRYTQYQKTNVKKLAKEEFFKNALIEHVRTSYTVISTQNLKKIDLDPYSPLCAAFYYYTLRNNVVHNGKNNVNEVRMLFDALRELNLIFNDVLDVVKRKGDKIKDKYGLSPKEEEIARKNPIRLNS